MICFGWITADKPSSSANKLPLMSRGREQYTVWAALHSLRLSRLAFKRALSFQDNSSDSAVSTYRQTRICQCLLCRATAALIHFLTGRFTSLYPVQLPSSRFHICDCRGSLSQLHTLCYSLQRGEKEEVERKNRLEHFSGVPSFFIWSARSCWTTNQKCAKEKEKTTKHRQELCIPASTRKSPILGQSRQLSLPHLLSFASLSLYGFRYGIHKWNSAVFSTHVSDCSARASFRNTMSSRQIWQVELRRQHIEVN